MISVFPYVFEAPISRYAFEKYAYTVLYLPSDLAGSAPFKDQARIRIVGEVADYPVSGAWQPAGGGRRYFLLSRRFLKEAGLAVGDVVEMRFGLDDPDSVSVPASLSQSLARNKKLRAAWDALTPGAQRAFAHRVASAKTAPTEQKRLSEVADMVLTGGKPGAPASVRRKRTRP